MRQRIAAFLALLVLALPAAAAAQQVHNRAGRAIMMYVFNTTDMLLAIACDSYQLSDQANERLAGNSKCPFQSFAVKIHRPDADIPAPADCVIRDIDEARTVMVEYDGPKGRLTCVRY